MALSISRYKQGRFWALYDAASTLIAVCVYKKGAQEVERRLQERSAQANVPCTCQHQMETGEEMREMGDRSEETAGRAQSVTAGELPPWTPFARTGQIVTVGLPDMPVGAIWENSRFVVVVRDCGGAGDQKMVWLSIKNVDNSARHDWRELQRVKNELVDLEAEAVELYPAESRLVDGANQFHLWCIIGGRFPFGFAERLVSESTPGVTQRPFGLDQRPTDLTTVHIEGLAQIDPLETPTLSLSGEPTDISVEMADMQAEVPVSLRLPLQREQKFALGEMAMTPGAATALRDANQTAEPYLLRHLAGEWGDDLDAHDRQVNEEALAKGYRLLSSYTLPTGAELWIITEADRASTTILTPEEY